MHYQKLTSVWMEGGRFLCIQIPAQRAQAALQGITYILYKYYPFENLTLLFAWVLFCANCDNLRQKTTNNLWNPWNQSPSNSERATETIRKQKQFGFSLPLFLSTFPPCAHHHSSWLLLLQNTNLWGSRGSKIVGIFPPNGSPFAG